MRIGLLGHRAGLRPSAIRYYESVGLLPPATRVSGRRDYGSDALNSLRLIRAAQQAGFTLAETRSLLALLKEERHSSRRCARWRGRRSTSWHHHRRPRVGAECPRGGD
jgi:DNA-binding transcriptional MerR regulator